MFSHRIRIAGILLVLAHVAQSFVLLTANIEDVKKIARKFVSEPMAQQIADFIAKAAGQQNANTNVSAENEQNEDKVDNTSDNDDPLSKAQRQGPEEYAASEMAAAGSSKRYRKQSRPTTPAGNFEGREQSREYRPPKKPQVIMRQRPKQREEVPPPKEDPFYPGLLDALPKSPQLQGGDQLKQHQHLQEQLETLQSQVKEGTLTDAVQKLNQKPKRFQKQRPPNNQQKYSQKKRAKPYQDQQQYQSGQNSQFYDQQQQPNKPYQSELSQNQLYKDLNKQIDKHQHIRENNQHLEQQFRESSQHRGHGQNKGQSKDRSSFSDQSQNYKSQNQYRDQPYGEQSQQRKDPSHYNDRNSKYKDDNPQYKDENSQYKEEIPKYKEEIPKYKEEIPKYKEEIPKYKDQDQQYKESNPQYQEKEGSETYQPERITQDYQKDYQKDRQAQDTRDILQTHKAPRQRKDRYDTAKDESKYIRNQNKYKGDRNRPAMEADQIIQDRQRESELRDNYREDVHRDTEQRINEKIVPGAEVEYEPTPKRHKSRARVHERFALLSDPTTEVTPTLFPAFNIGADAELTTEKEKNEFDQYDNLRPQPLIATSGPVALKAADPWWPKDSPMARSHIEEELNALNAQVAPVEIRPMGLEKSTMVINLFEKVDETTPSTTTINFANLGNLGNLI